MDANNRFAGLKKKCADDCACDADTDYPVTVEDALAVLQTKHEQMRGEGKNGETRLNFAQFPNQRKANAICFKCSKKGHNQKECPDNSNNEDDMNDFNVDVWGDQCVGLQNG